MSKEYLKTAVEAALLAGKLQLKNYGKLKTAQIAQKTKNDFVTEIDKKSEKIIMDIILKKYPKHTFLAEESGVSGSGSDICWIIDPLDGTSNYIHQFPMFAVSIGIKKGNDLVAGVIYDSVHDELFTVTKGGGSFLNKKKIHVSPIKKLADSMMSTGIPFRARARYEEYFASLKDISLKSCGMRRGGSAALDLAYVACGRFDGFWEINLSPWDIAAGALLIEEAGGKVTDVWGGQTYLNNGDILSTNKNIHAELQQITGSLFSRKD